MNKLDRKTRAQILHLLCEGQSIRAVTRLTGCSKNTVAKLLFEAGHACAAYQDKALRKLPCKRVQMDEIWSFVYAKNDNVKDAKAAPDKKHISTSYVERSNLTMRMHMRRFTRLTNAFSKKVENHAHAVALHFMYYNFIKLHRTLRVTPAMAAGVTDRLWEIADIAQLVADAEEGPK